MPVSVILLAASVFAADLKVDHITIAGRDLKQLQSQFAAAGIPSEYGGKHTNGLTEMAIASFADGSYLELIAAQKPTGAAEHYWGKFIDANAGPCAWAVSVPDVAAAVPGSHPARSGRSRPDGVKLEWESASIGPEAQGTFFPFFIHDLTPRERRAFPHGKPSAPRFSGVAHVVIGVQDLDLAIDRYRKAFHLSVPKRLDDQMLQAHLAFFEGTPVVLASPLRGSTALATRLAKFGEAPCAFVLQLGPNGGGMMGAGSNWFGQTIFWDFEKNLNFPWIGIGMPKP
jgi:catechol 2,3-dioxygenase-like lactoylglutathione lyase family enzyme